FDDPVAVTDLVLAEVPAFHQPDERVFTPEFPVAQRPDFLFHRLEVEAAASRFAESGGKPPHLCWLSSLCVSGPLPCPRKSSPLADGDPDFGALCLRLGTTRSWTPLAGSGSRLHLLTPQRDFPRQPFQLLGGPVNVHQLGFGAPRPVRGE